MNIETFSVYDRFPSESILPIQCVITVPFLQEPGTEDRLVITATGNNKVEASKIIPLALTMDRILVSLPCPAGCSRMKVNFAVFNGADKVAEDTLEFGVFGYNEIMLGLGSLPDSMYVRSLPRSRLVSKKDVLDTAKLVPYKGATEPVLETALDYMTAIIEILNSYKILETKTEGDLMTIGSILDSVEEGEGTKYSLGLLFFNVASNLGLNPILVFGKDTCLCGLEIDSVDFDHSKYWEKTLTISSSSKKIPFVNYSGRFLMNEIDPTRPLEETIESAYTYCKKNRVGEYCCIKKMQEQREQEAELIFKEVL